MKHTIFIDASALKNSACGLKVFYTVVKGYRAKYTTNIIAWGSGFHKFRALHRGRNPRALIEAIQLFESTPKVEVKKFLTKGSLATACMDYAEKFPMDKDILQPIEGLIEPASRFAIPYASEPEVDVIIAGTMDSVEHKKREAFSEACNLIVDAKTTGTWKVREYMDSYRLSPQLLMYRWAIRQYAKMRPESIWAKLDQTKLGCMIEGIFYTAKPDDTGATVKFIRSEPIFFTDNQLETFERMLKIAIAKIIADVKIYVHTGKIPDPDGIMCDACNTKYGPCNFADVCLAPDDEAMESILERDFKVEHYNPLEFK